MDIADRYFSIDGQIWHTARGAYVAADDADLVASGQTPHPAAAGEVRALLRANGLLGKAPPPPDAADVRAEAQRRIMALVGAATLDACFVKQLNALMRATELANMRAAGGVWTTAEAAEAAALQGMADAIKAIRAESNTMEASPPDDYLSDNRWP